MLLLVQHIQKQCLNIQRLCKNKNHAWDSACGNGQAAVHLAKYFQHVSATDVSENQIINAIIAPNVSYGFGSSEKTNFPDSSFDLILVAQALHWFKFDQFWPEADRVLKPGGIFAACGYCWFKISPDIDQQIQTLLLTPIAPFWAEQNKILWNHYQDVEIPFN